MSETTAEADGTGDGVSELAKLRHDLRTPLNQILGYSELIAETAEDEDIAGLEITAMAVNKAGNDMLGLLNDAMSPWKIAAGSFSLVALREEMQEPIGRIDDRLAEGLQIASGADNEEIAADLEKISTAVQNLNVLLAEAREPVVPPAVAPRTGMTVPPFSARDPAYGVAQDSKLLLVDDDVINREMMSRRLKHMGFNVVLAEDGYRALEAMAEEGFDLVLLDIMMPGIDGFQTLAKIKENDAWDNIPIIMLTALDDAESTGRCIAAGAEDYAPKPFNTTVLRARIGSALEKRRLRGMEEKYLARIKELELELQNFIGAAS